MTRHYAGIRDEILYMEWKRVETELGAELALVQQLNSTVLCTRPEEGKPSSTGDMQIEPRIPPNPVAGPPFADNGNLRDQKPLPPPKKPEKKYPFGQAPFSYNGPAQGPSEPDPLQQQGSADEDDPNLKPHLIYVKQPNQPQSGQGKDPDVWDPPSPSGGGRWPKVPTKNPKAAAGKPVSKAGPPPKAVAGKAAPAGAPKKGRDYSKPWQANAGGGQVEGGDPKLNPDGSKKTFLQFCYPEGSGPDADLIANLEREVVRTIHEYVHSYSLTKIPKSLSKISQS